MPIFQSTLPYGSDILLILLIICSLRYFNPRSLTGATLTPVYLNDVLHIYFNPRSLTGATRTIAVFFITVNISIHAPLRERPLIILAGCVDGYFNPRSLTGATSARSILILSLSFQSTLPYGSDKNDVQIIYKDGISIHAPLRERQ